MPNRELDAFRAPEAVLLPGTLARPLDASRRLRALLLEVTPVADALLAVAFLAVAGVLASAWQALAVIAVVVVMSRVAGVRASRLAIGSPLLEDLPRFNHVAVVTSLSLIMVCALEGTPRLTATEIALTWAFVLAAMVLGRFAGMRLTARFAPAERCLVVGGADRRDRFDRCVASAGNGRFDVVGDIELDRVGRGDGRQAIEELIARYAADRVVVLDGADPVRAAQVARRARNAGARVSLAHEAIESVGPPEYVEHLGCAVLLSHSPAPSVATRMAGKRALDLLGAGLGVVALAPVLAVIALAIKLTSAGPVLFWQDRIGLDGRRFRIAKFRTMCADAEAQKAELRAQNEAGGGLFKIADDPRITRVGRILRKTSLDELPQLLNVLRGEMSLVGPRPLVCDEDALIGGWYRDRLQLKPGMTGRWQIMGSARIPLHDMIRLDQQYVASWSLWLDLRILLRTALFVVRRRGM